MNADLQKLFDLFIRNRAELRSRMGWEMDPNQEAIMGSYLFSAQGKTVDPEKLERCKALLKDSAGAFSEFRGYARPMVLSKMALADDPEDFLAGSMEIYRKLRDLHKLTASPFMVMAAMTLYENGGREHADENIGRLEALYRKEKAEHPLIITDNDRGYLALIVTAFRDVDAVSREIEACYEAARDMSLSQDAVHSLAQILTFSSLPAAQKVALVSDVIERLKAAGHPIRKQTTLPAIGALASLNVPAETLVAEITEVADCLKHEKGFHWLSADAKDRVMYAALLVFTYHAGADSHSLAGSISGTVFMTIIEEMTMLIICETAALTLRTTKAK